MNVLFGNDSYNLFVSVGDVSASDGVYTVKSDVTMMTLQSRRWHEIVDRYGQVFLCTKYRTFSSPVGTKFTVRLAVPPRTNYTKAEIDKARTTTTITVCDQEQYDGGPFDFGASYEDGSLSRVISNLIAIRDGIPEEYRQNARCGIDSVGGYEGSHYAQINVNYQRPETDEEVVARLQDADIERVVRERDERAKLAALQAKYKDAS